MEFIKVVADEYKLKEGFKQTGVKNDSFEILLNRVEKGVCLDGHAHKFSQFGYCFKGIFNFAIEDKTYRIKENNTYDIKGYLKHSAEFITDICALDLKYTQDIREESDIIMNVLKEEDHLSIYENNIVRIKIINNKVAEPREIICEQNEYLIMDQDINIFHKEYSMKLDSRKIYKVMQTEKVCVNQATTIILIQFK